jgi:hypothetical protein
MLTNVLKSMLVLALPPALLSAFGLILAAYLRLVRERNGFRYCFVYIQFVRSLAILFLMGYIASNIYGLRILFASFNDIPSGFLYYSMIYFGGLVWLSTGPWRSFTLRHSGIDLGLGGSSDERSDMCARGTITPTELPSRSA